MCEPIEPWAPLFWGRSLHVAASKVWRYRLLAGHFQRTYLLSERREEMEIYLILEARYARDPPPEASSKEESDIADALVSSITKRDRDSQHEGITHLGVPGSRKWTREAIIASIRAKTNTFYTLVDGKRAGIGVVHAGDVRRGQGFIARLRFHIGDAFNRRDRSQS